MHFGKISQLCPTLKVHQSDMKDSQKQTYLGDVYTVDFKIEENIKIRHNKGMGIVDDIMTKSSIYPWLFFL